MTFDQPDKDEALQLDGSDSFPRKREEVGLGKAKGEGVIDVSTEET